MLTASLKPSSSCPFCCNTVQHVTTGTGQTAQICCFEKGYWRAQYAAGQSRQPKGLHTGSPADLAASACAAEVQRRVPDTERSGCAQCCKGCCSQRGSLRLHHRLHRTLGAQQSDQEDSKHTTRLRVMLISMLAACRAHERCQACLQAHNFAMEQACSFRAAQWPSSQQVLGMQAYTRCLNLLPLHVQGWALPREEHPPLNRVWLAFFVSGVSIVSQASCARLKPEMAASHAAARSSERQLSEGPLPPSSSPLHSRYATRASELKSLRNSCADVHRFLGFRIRIRRLFASELGSLRHSCADVHRSLWLACLSATTASAPPQHHLQSGVLPRLYDCKQCVHTAAVCYVETQVHSQRVGCKRQMGRGSAHRAGRGCRGLVLQEYGHAARGAHLAQDGQPW